MSATLRDEEIQIIAGGLTLAGHLTVPAGATGIVIFAHGSGSSLHSRRNRAVATLWAATDQEVEVSAVVSRGGRPDLAGSRLQSVKAATLLIVGGLDEVVIDLNRQAQAELSCENDLVIIPGVTHLFEEFGALEHVADLAADWFTSHWLNELMQ